VRTFFHNELDYFCDAFMETLDPYMPLIVAIGNKEADGARKIALE
jgi:hypothetical protein